MPRYEYRKSSGKVISCDHLDFLFLQAILKDFFNSSATEFKIAYIPDTQPSSEIEIVFSASSGGEIRFVRSNLPGQGSAYPQPIQDFISQVCKTKQPKAEATFIDNPSGANFCWYDLQGVDFRGKNLQGTDFSGANLAGANLTGANLSGADLRGANLYHVQWKEAIVDNKTQMTPEQWMGYCWTHQPCVRYVYRNECGDVISSDKFDNDFLEQIVEGARHIQQFTGKIFVVSVNVSQINISDITIQIAGDQVSSKKTFVVKSDSKKKPKLLKQVISILETFQEIAVSLSSKQPIHDDQSQVESLPVPTEVPGSVFQEPVNHQGQVLSRTCFKNAKFLQSVDFSQATLIGVDLGGAQFLEPVTFNFADLTGENLNGTRFFKTVDFSDADLTRADLRGAVFPNNTDLSEVTWTGVLMDDNTSLNWAEYGFDILEQNPSDPSNPANQQLRSLVLRKMFSEGHPSATVSQDPASLPPVGTIFLDLCKAGKIDEDEKEKPPPLQPIKECIQKLSSLYELVRLQEQLELHRYDTFAYLRRQPRWFGRSPKEDVDTQAWKDIMKAIQNRMREVVQSISSSEEVKEIQSTKSLVTLVKSVLEASQFLDKTTSNAKQKKENHACVETIFQKVLTQLLALLNGSNVQSIIEVARILRKSQSYSDSEDFRKKLSKFWQTLFVQPLFEGADLSDVDLRGVDWTGVRLSENTRLDWIQYGPDILKANKDKPELCALVLRQLTVLLESDSISLEEGFRFLQAIDQGTGLEAQKNSNFGRVLTPLAAKYKRDEDVIDILYRLWMSGQSAGNDTLTSNTPDGPSHASPPPSPTLTPGTSRSNASTFSKLSPVEAVKSELLGRIETYSLEQLAQLMYELESNETTLFAHLRRESGFLGLSKRENVDTKDWKELRKAIQEKMRASLKEISLKPNLDDTCPSLEQLEALLKTVLAASDVLKRTTSDSIQINEDFKILHDILFLIGRRFEDFLNIPNHDPGKIMEFWKLFNQAFCSYPDSQQVWFIQAIAERLSKCNTLDEPTKKKIYEGAYLESAGLSLFKGQNLSFRNANLRKSDLVGAHFQGADVTEADLTGADLSGVQWAGVKMNASTKLDWVKYGSAILKDNLGNLDLFQIILPRLLWPSEPSSQSISFNEALWLLEIMDPSKNLLPEANPCFTFILKKLAEKYRFSQRVILMIHRKSWVPEREEQLLISLSSGQQEKVREGQRFIRNKLLRVLTNKISSIATVEDLTQLLQDLRDKQNSDYASLRQERRWGQVPKENVDTKVWNEIMGQIRMRMVVLLNEKLAEIEQRTDLTEKISVLTQILQDLHSKEKLAFVLLCQDQSTWYKDSPWEQLVRKTRKALLKTTRSNSQLVKSEVQGSQSKSQEYVRQTSWGFMRSELMLKDGPVNTPEESSSVASTSTATSSQDWKSVVMDSYKQCPGRYHFRRGLFKAKKASQPQMIPVVISPAQTQTQTV